MTHISEMTRHARRPYLVLLAVWRASGETLNAVATPADIDHYLAVLGEEAVTNDDLFILFEKGWIFDVDFEMTAQLKPPGVQVAKEVSDQVADAMVRTKNLRTALLRWIWEQTDGAGQERIRPDKIRETGLSYFGSPYSQHEVGRAASYLEDRGWIEGPGIGRGQGPIKAKLTPAGRAQVEGDVDPTPAVVQSVSHTYINSNVAQDSPHAVQSMDNRVTNAEGVQAVLELVRQWQQNLTAENRIEELEEAITVVEEAVQEGAQKSSTTKALGRLKDVIQDSTSGAVGQAGGAGLVFAITGLLQTLGWA